jgi:Fe-S cluster assembly protein SufD
MEFVIGNQEQKHTVEEVTQLRSTYSLRIGENAHSTFILLINRPAETELQVSLEKPGASATIIALVRLSQGSVSLQTTQHHLAPSGKSRLIVKSVLGQTAAFSFSGLIRLEKTAQKTDAYQRNDNLVLSDTVQVKTQPVLEILAHDVRCTHGASTGRPSPEELWYLASRGISPVNAARMISRGFLYSGLDTVSQAEVKAAVVQRINKWL